MRFKRTGSVILQPKVKKTCSVSGCTAPHQVKGYCEKHWRRWRKHGDPLKGARPERQPCIVTGCQELAEADGRCGRHYMRWRRYGDDSYVTPESVRVQHWQTSWHDNEANAPAPTTYRKRGRTHEHRIVAAEKLGRPLAPGEVVHHENGDKHDNQSSNLKPMMQTLHIDEHRDELVAAYRQKLVAEGTARLVTIDGETKFGVDWARQFGVPVERFYKRLYAGWPPELAARAPVGMGLARARIEFNCPDPEAESRDVLLTLDGETRRGVDWARRFGISDGAYYARIGSGWPVEIAVRAPAGTKLAQARVELGGEAPANTRGRGNVRLITIRGETRSVTGWAKLVGLAPVTIFRRLAAGWPEDLAFLTPAGEEPADPIDRAA